MGRWSPAVIGRNKLLTTIHILLTIFGNRGVEVSVDHHARGYHVTDGDLGHEYTNFEPRRI